MRPVMAIDPSGNFEQGKGHTGIAISAGGWENISIESINAKNFNSRIDYWKTVTKRVASFIYTYRDQHPVVVIEKFVNRSNGFTTGKMSETVMLIGVITYICEDEGVEVVFQTPSQAKGRYSDVALCKLFPGMEHKALPNDRNRFYYNGELTNDHERDAMKHLAYYRNYMEE